MTMVYAIVNNYPTFTEMGMTKKETEFLESLLEENTGVLGWNANFKCATKFIDVK